MSRKPKVPISTARKQLFQLADLVREAGDDAAVVFEQRGGLEPVALVRAAHLAYLEERVMQLEKRHEPARTPFVLRGSLAAVLQDDELDQALREIRRGWSGPAADATAGDDPRRAPARRRATAKRRA
jgi:hypothetical protein